MDDLTKRAYELDAAKHSQDWQTQPPPADLYDLLRQHFVPGGRTADVGCGDGRDAAWLESNGFHVTGYDASDALLAIAGRRYPKVEFRRALFPALQEIAEQFDNVLCETVIMHLPKAEIAPAVLRLKEILRPGGILYVSWRVTEGSDDRSPDGRLYSAFAPDLVVEQLGRDGVVHFEDRVSVSSGKRVCRILYARRG